jgi:hypothetical protein
MQTTRQAAAKNEENNLLYAVAWFDGSWQRRGHISLNGIISGTSFVAGNISNKNIINKICVLSHTTRTYKSERKHNY